MMKKKLQLRVKMMVHRSQSYMLSSYDKVYGQKITLEYNVSLP